MANYRVTAETGRILRFCFCNEDTGEINITKVPSAVEALSQAPASGD
jgi:hypothetical protein